VEGASCQKASRDLGERLSELTHQLPTSIAKLHATQDPQLNPSTTQEFSILSYLNTTSEKILETSRSQYDVVCSMEVIEHVNNPADFLRSCANLVKPGGHIFLSSISRTPLARLLTITMAEDVLKLVSPGTYAYEKYVKPSELVSFFRDNLEWIPKASGPEAANLGRLPHAYAEVRGMMYLPWSGSWVLAPRGAPFELDCNYIFWARKPLTLM